jgi:serine/threonine-protein kinase
LPVEGDELHRAAAVIDRAVAARRPENGWASPYFLFAQALAEYRRGQFKGVVWLLSGDADWSMQPSGRLVLAMAQYRLGQKEQTRRTLALAIRSLDWSARLADWHDAWIAHILRREAEAMILPNLPAFLKGDYQPQDNDERAGARLAARRPQGLGENDRQRSGAETAAPVVIRCQPCRRAR